MNIILKNTPETYKKMVDEIIPPLLELLQELTLLEEEIFKRNHELDVEKSILNIPSNQIHPKWKELMTEYENRFEEMITGKVSENLMSKGYATHYGNPSEYFYVNHDDFLLEFTMQQADMAVIVIHYQGAVDMKHKFMIRLINKKWLVDEKYYGFEDETLWYEDSI
ncbi:hypothetical protein [Filifactor alocis]|nr:hypothetical protein [Filifactor alocis]